MADAVSTYDEVAYVSRSFAQTHPDRLATLAVLFGMTPPLITNARILELGCGQGDNLIPMAYHLPDSEFVGIDLSAKQIQSGQASIKALGLGNIRMIAGSLMDMDDTWDKFDYIIAHGVFSWVPDAVASKILEIAHRQLTPNGVAYVSYNTYPGWRMRQMVREMLLYHVNKFEGAKTRIEQAQAMISFLSEATPDQKGEYAVLLKKIEAICQRTGPAYFFHEYLEDENRPLYFHEFIKRAAAYELQYLAEADAGSMFLDGFPQGVAETLGQISHDIVDAEQYIDFLHNRSFRQTLLCHAGIPLNRRVAWEVLEGLSVCAAPNMTLTPVDFKPGSVMQFGIPGGMNITSDRPVVKAALYLLAERKTRILTFDDLFERSLKVIQEEPTDVPESLSQLRKILGNDLLKCYTAGVVELHTWQADFIGTVSERPQVSALGRFYAQKGLAAVNQRHETIGLTPQSREVVGRLDGSRTCAELNAMLSSPDVKAPCEDSVSILTGLARQAMLIA